MLGVCWGYVGYVEGMLGVYCDYDEGMLGLWGGILTVCL